MSDAELSPGAVWHDRLFERIPLPPFGVGAAIALGLLAVFGGLGLLTGELARLGPPGAGWWQHRDLRLGILLALLAGTLPAALRYHTLGSARNSAALAESGLWPASTALLFPPRELSRSSLRVGLWCLLIVPVFAVSIDRDPTLYFTDWYWNPGSVFSWSVGLFTAFATGVFLTRVRADAQRFAELARAIPRVDLFEARALLPFARQGLRSAVPGLIFVTFLAPNLVDRGFWFAIIGFGGMMLALSAASLLLPVRGVRLRLQAAKRDELDRLNAALRGEPGALQGSPLANRPELSVADLLAYRRFVESVPEWPIDAGTLGRIGIYVGIPLLSWVGAALVERGLDVAIG